MILNLFILFIVLAILFSIIGFGFQIHLFAMVGTIMICLLGINLLTEPLTYVSGETINYNYGTNLSNVWANNGGDVPDNTSIHLFETSSTKTYSEYDDSTNNRFGFLLIGLGALGFCLALFMLF